MSETLRQTFPKSARLLKKREFFLQPCERFQTEHFRFFYCRAGKGRMGVSLSKKVMRRAVARNRVRRLLREVYREKRSSLGPLDVHIVGKEELKAQWFELGKAQVREEFERWQWGMRKKERQK